MSATAAAAEQGAGRQAGVSAVANMERMKSRWNAENKELLGAFAAADKVRRPLFRVLRLAFSV